MQLTLKDWKSKVHERNISNVKIETLRQNVQSGLRHSSSKNERLTSIDLLPIICNIIIKDSSFAFKVGKDSFAKKQNIFHKENVR